MEPFNEILLMSRVRATLCIKNWSIGHYKSHFIFLLDPVQKHTNLKNFLTEK